MVLTRLAATLLEFVRVPLAVRECAVKDGSGPTGWQNCFRHSRTKNYAEPTYGSRSVGDADQVLRRGERSRSALHITTKIYRYAVSDALVCSTTTPTNPGRPCSSAASAIGRVVYGMRQNWWLALIVLGCPPGPAHGCAGRTRRRKRAALGRCVLPRSCWRAAWAEGSRSFIDLCGAAASRGYEVLAIGAAESDAMDALDRRSDLQCARVRCHGTWDPLCRWAIGRLLRRFEPDVVQTHMGRASALGGKAARSAGYPTLAMLHTMIELKYYRAIDLFVPTTADQEAYLRRNGVTADRVERIPHFRSMEPVAIARLPRQTDGVVKTLGRFVHKKGFDVLLHAAAHAAKQGAPFRLEIGGDGPERGSLKALAARLGIGDRVTFCGWIDDVAAFLADADLFVLPSRIEPFRHCGPGGDGLRCSHCRHARQRPAGDAGRANRSPGSVRRSGGNGGGFDGSVRCARCGGDSRPRGARFVQGELRRVGRYGSIPGCLQAPRGAPRTG